MSAPVVAARTIATLQSLPDVDFLEAAAAMQELQTVALARVWRAFYDLTTSDITKVTDGLETLVTWTGDLAEPPSPADPADYVGPALPMVGDALNDKAKAFAINQILSPFSGLGPFDNGIQLLNALNAISGVTATIDATRVYNGRGGSWSCLLDTARNNHHAVRTLQLTETHAYHTLVEFSVDQLAITAEVSATDVTHSSLFIEHWSVFVADIDDHAWQRRDHPDT